MAEEDFTSGRQKRRTKNQSEYEYRDRSRSPPKLSEEHRRREIEREKLLFKHWGKMHQEARDAIQKAIDEEDFEIFKVKINSSKKKEPNYFFIEVDPSPDCSEEKTTGPTQVTFQIPPHSEIEFHLLTAQNTMLIRTMYVSFFLSWFLFFFFSLPHPKCLSSLSFEKSSKIRKKIKNMDK